jgi:[acyl-carrier-protein] S-malonyltransferase
LKETELRDAEIPVYANVTAAPVTKASDIRELLCRQLTAPVRWEQGVRNMAGDGASEFYELGPGKVLQRLVGRTVEGVRTSGYDKLADLQ